VAAPAGIQEGRSWFITRRLHDYPHRTGTPDGTALTTISGMVGRGAPDPNTSLQGREYRVAGAGELPKLRHGDRQAELGRTRTWVAEPTVAFIRDVLGPHPEPLGADFWIATLPDGDTACRIPAVPPVRRPRRPAPSSATARDRYEPKATSHDTAAGAIPEVPFGQAPRLRRPRADDGIDWRGALDSRRRTRLTVRIRGRTLISTCDCSRARGTLCVAPFLP
jgi:hypothetical protein